MALSDSNNEKIEKFLENKLVLIVDASPMIHQTLTEFFESNKVTKKNISTATHFSQAQQIIETLKPDIIIADCDLDNKRGFDLIQEQIKVIPEKKKRLFIILSSNSSQVSVSKAIEAGVNSYLLKPFDAKLLKSSILKVALSRIQPHEYDEAIERGKTCIDQEKLDEAEKIFQSALTMNPKPALAYSYLGKIHFLNKKFEEAETMYQEGLNFNKRHLKCLLGLFDVFKSKSRWAETYTVAKRICYYYPANPKYLSEALKLAIIVRSYEDVERYYRAFSQSLVKDSEMIKYMSAALIVCGKYYLNKSIRTRGLHVLRCAAEASDNEPRIIKEVIVTLLDNKLEQETNEYLKLISDEAKTSNEYQVIDFIISDKKQSAMTSIHKGETLIEKGIEDPLVYSITIRRYIEAKNLESAKKYIDLAVQKWPNQKTDFENLLQKSP
jgi:DNA-binding response OmpR family regulator